MAVFIEKVIVSALCLSISAAFILDAVPSESIARKGTDVRKNSEIAREMDRTGFSL